jgi:hypothetical protein
MIAAKAALLATHWWKIDDIVSISGDYASIVCQ